MQAAACETDLFERLRWATAEGHRRLETDLALLQAPLSRGRFVHVLERFLGFHRVWEAAVARHPPLEPVLAGRSRLPHLRHDLAALGLTGGEISAVPACEAAEALAATPQSALGSLYVMEGSTLGGQVIGRALLQAPWAPEGGLSYFQPYGARTGEMWRSFKAWGREAWPEAARPEIETGARDTFALLHLWLTPDLAQ